MLATDKFVVDKADYPQNSSEIFGNLKKSVVLGVF